jgi:hypothetical protein
LRFQEIEVYEKHERPKYLAQITKSTRTLITHPKIRSIVFFCMIYMLFSCAGFWMIQPYLKAVYLPIRYFGPLFAGLNLVAAFSSRWTPQYLKFSKGWSLIGLMGILLLSFWDYGTYKQVPAFSFYPYNKSQGASIAPQYKNISTNIFQARNGQQYSPCRACCRT